MADTYSSIVTNDGESTLLQNTVNAYIFKLARIEICSRANLDMTDAMTWKSMEAANVVYTISKQENINSMVRKVQLDSNTVQFRVSLDTSIGGISSSGMICGSIGLYLQGYNERGEALNTPFLFAVGSLGSEFVKYADSSNTVGNMVSFYLNFRISNTALIENVLVAPTENFSLPTVDTENSDYLNDYFNAYIVNNYDRTGLSAIAYKTNKNSEGFAYVLPKNESTTRLGMGGVYEAPELDPSVTDASFKRFAYYKRTGNTYSVCLEPGRTLALTNGLESDGFYRNERFLLDKPYESNVVTNAGEYVTLAVNGVQFGKEDEEEQFYLITVPSDCVKTVNDKDLNNIEHPKTKSDVYFIFNTLTGFVHETTVSQAYEVKATKLAFFKINSNGDLDYFIQVTSASGSNSFEVNSVKADMKKLRSEFEDGASNKFVHFVGTETISGKKVFTADGTSALKESLQVFSKNPTIGLKVNTTNSFVGGVVAKNSNDQNITSLYMNNKAIGVVSWPDSAINGNKNNTYSTGEYLLIDSSKTGNSVVSESTNVKNHFIQNTLDKLSVVKITDNSGVAGFQHANTVYFSKNIQAGLFRGAASYTYWADLAEMYESDMKLQPGTLVKFGGKKDITIAENEECAEGVISTKPGVVLNSLSEGEYMYPVALVGQVPVRVIGSVKKHDYIYHSSVIGKDLSGVAIASSKKILNAKIIGKALEDNLNEDEKLVNCVVRLVF